jgi:hypothetical protein
MKTGQAYDEIEQSLMNKYSVEITTFERDYFDFIGLLKQHNLIDTNEEA